MQETFSQEQVATVLEVSVDTLRQYRSKRFANSPLRLVPTGPMVGKAKHYTREDLVDWFARNPAKLAVATFNKEERAADAADFSWWLSHAGQNEASHAEG